MEPNSEQSFDAQLEALRPTPQSGPPASPEATPPPASEPPQNPEAPSSLTPATPVTPPATPEPTLDEKLSKIEEPTTPPVAPTLSDEQKQVLSLIPNSQTAKNVTELASSYQNFTSTFERGDFDSVERMFESWNPEAYSAFLEHVYSKKVASGEWVDRWIADKEGNQTVHKGMTRLEQQIASLQAQLARQESTKSAEAQRYQQEQISRNYVAHLDKLFDQIDFSKADRRWVLSDIHARVAADNSTRSSIASGNMNAVNSIFKTAVKEYVERDKALADGRQSAATQQEKHKPLVQSGTVPSGALPSDINQVPKEQREQWFDEQLGALALRAKGRK